MDDFLQAIWPTAGNTAIVRISDSDVSHFWFSSARIADAVSKALALVAKGADVYFSLAGFSGRERKTEQAVALKCVWLDVDVGEGPNKNYLTVADALAALTAFVTDSTLPYPIVVHSGYGLHLYWLLGEALPLHEWRVLADNLKLLCAKHGMKADMGCTSDASRILRPPGTKNFKFNSTREVTCATLVVEHASVRAILGWVPDVFTKLASEVPVGTKAQTTAFNDADSLPSDLDVILAKCATIRWAYENQDQVSEPLWHDVLGVAGRTSSDDDPHRISNRHPEYDRDGTTRKTALRMAAGPTTCAQFRSQPLSKCAGCTETCTTPLQLGRPLNVVIVDSRVTPNGSKRFIHPSLRLDNVGYCVMTTRQGNKGDEKISEWVKISKHALTPLLELRQPDVNGIPSNFVWFEAYDTQGYTQNSFLVPSQGITNSMQFSADCSKQGFYLESEPAPLAFRTFHKIMRTWVEDMKQQQGSIVTFRSFGWVGPDDAGIDKQDSFLLGNLLYTPNGTHMTPKTAVLSSFQKDLVGRGDLDTWIETMDHYNIPGMESQMFATWVGWGSPLMPFTTTGTSIFHLQGTTGAGKTSLQRSIISIYGDYNSKQLLDVNNSTLNSMGKTMGLLNSLPYFKEEITEALAEELASWALTATQGREKQRMNQTNGIAQVSTWSLIACTSANQSLREIIVTQRQDNAPRLARVWEQTITLPMEQYEASRLFAPLKINYGLAGPIFIDYVVRNKAAVAVRVAECEERFSIQLRAQGADRFHVALIAACYIGVCIAYELGLTNHDLKRGLEFAIRQYYRLRRTAKAEQQSCEQTLARFMQESQPHTLVVDVDLPGNNVTMFSADNNIIRNVSQNNPITMRYARQSGMFYATSTVIRRWYAENHVNFEQDMTELERSGVLLQRNKRIVLTKGTKLSDDKQVYALWFDLTKANGLIDVIMEEAA